MTPLLDSTLVGEPHARASEGLFSDRVLVLGVGNVLMGDEGVGVHVIRELEKHAPCCGVRLLDGGTGGVNLLGEFDVVHAVLLVDATRDGQPDGTITHLRPKRVSDLPRGLGAHDFGLKDLFAACALIGRLPQLHVYTVSVSTIHPMTTTLSDAVATAVPKLAESVRAQANDLAAEAQTAAPPQNKTSTARNVPTDAQPMIR